jgi:c-di-GMP-binding flagellar brake protein YcgR
MDMENRRRHRRVPLAAAARITLKSGEEAEPVRACIADISLSGIGLYSTTPIGEEADLSILVSFVSSDGALTGATLSGTSVYSRDLKDFYFVGVEFDEEITAQNQATLYPHLQRILTQE